MIAVWGRPVAQYISVVTQAIDVIEPLRSADRRLD
jgi:hypothetical protein